MKLPSKRSILIFGLILLEAGLLSALLIASVDQYYPNIGMDYKYFVPRLIDSFLHYQINGLSVQWYTPSFGGGLPSYPNPQQIQFSLPQLFTQFTDPYTSLLISLFVFSWIGIAASYWLFKYILGFGTTASLLSGVFFLANGFYFQHAGIGHVTFITLPLLPLLLLGALRPRQSLFNGVIIGFVVAALLHHGSFYLTIYFALSSVLFFALVGVIAPSKLILSRVSANIGIGIIFALTLSASKLDAVLHFLRLFPRQITDEFSASLTQALISVPYQLLGSMSLRPIGMLTGVNPKLIWDALMTYTGSQLAFWELDISVTPIIWLILAAGAVLLGQGILQRRVRFTHKQWISLLFAIVWVELIIEFIIARGLFYPTLSKLPILSSLHVNPRYTLTLVYPIALIAAFTYDRLFQRANGKPHLKAVVFIITLILALAPLSVYLEMPMDKLGRRQFNVEGSIEVYVLARHGETFPIEKVAADMNDARVFDQHASNLNPYEVLFGYNLGEFDHQLAEGSPYTIVNGAYNFNNPAALVFPESNNAQPFDRISESERGKLDLLLTRRQPNWVLPQRQLFADRLTALSIVVSVVIILTQLFARKNREEES